MGHLQGEQGVLGTCRAEGHLHDRDAASPDERRPNEIRPTSEHWAELVEVILDKGWAMASLAVSLERVGERHGVVGAVQRDDGDDLHGGELRDDLVVGRLVRGAGRLRGKGDTEGGARPRPIRNTPAAGEGQTKWHVGAQLPTKGWAQPARS